MLSLAALASVPVIPAYSISKAAAFSLTQSLRALLAGRGVSVHAVLTGPVDTDMTRAWTSRRPARSRSPTPSSTALRAGEDDIFPDPMSAQIAPAWNEGIIKTLERANAAAVQAVAASS